MPKAAASRVTNVQTPGAEAPAGQDDTQDTTSTDAGPQAENTGDELPPDVQAIVDARVAAAVKADRRLRGAVVKTASGLPTQAEALAQVNADPKRRSVLSEDGWVVTSKPLDHAGRDGNGFAKA